MSIVISPETEAKLRAQAQREGIAPDALAETILADALDWEAQERAETVEGIRRGLEASDAGRVRPLAEFAAEMRARYKLPDHLSDEEIHAE